MEEYGEDGDEVRMPSLPFVVSLLSEARASTVCRFAQCRMSRVVVLVAVIDALGAVRLQPFFLTNNL